MASQPTPGTLLTLASSEGLTQIHAAASAHGQAANDAHRYRQRFSARGDPDEVHPHPDASPRSGTDTETCDPDEHDEYHDEVLWRLGEFADKVVRIEPTFEVWGTPISGRMKQSWTPLWSIAVALGGPWPDRVQAAAQTHQFGHEISVEARVLAATRDAFTDLPGDRIAASALADYISGYDDTPAKSPKGLHASMKTYGILPSKSNGTSTYWRRDMEPVWAEWLPKAA